MKFSTVARAALFVIMSSGAAMAQDVTIDYTSPNLGVSNCNVFANGYTINGIYHKSNIGGQSLIGGLAMPGYQNWINDVRHGSEFELDYNFLQGHTYKIGVSGSGVPNSVAMRVEIADPSALTSTACGHGPVSETASGPFYYVFSLSSTSITNFTHNFTITEDKPTLRLTHTSIINPMSTVPTAYIYKITIQDLTPSFPLTSSVASKTCGTQTPVTFTVGNPTAASVTGYSFYPEAGSYLYQGSPAPAVINTTSNSITLTALECAGKAPVYATVGYGGQNVKTNTKTFSVVTPDLQIYGPATLEANQSGFYSVQGTLSTPINYNWPCTFFGGWSSSQPSLTHFYSTTTSRFETNFYTNFTYPYHDVLLTASVSMCGVEKTLSKDISITGGPIGPIGPLSKTVALNGDQELNLTVSPNPSNGVYNITFNKMVTDADVIVTTIDGKSMLKSKATGLNVTIDLTQYPAGVYLIKVNDGMKPSVEKLIKN